MPSRRTRKAAVKAEASVGAIAQQDVAIQQELRHAELYQERSAHIHRLPSKIITLSFKSGAARTVLQILAKDDPDDAIPVRPFVTLRCANGVEKQKLKEICQKPIVIEDDSERGQEEDRNGSHSNICDTPDETAMNDFHTSSSTFAAIAESQDVCRRHRSSSLPPFKNTLNDRAAEPVVRPPTVFLHHPPTQRIIFNTETPRRWTQPQECPVPDIEDELPLPATNQSLEPIVQDDDEDMDAPLGNEVVDSPSETMSTRYEDINTWIGTSTNLDFMSLPPRNLPEHCSYRVGPRLDQRLMKYQPPLNKWAGSVSSVYNNDYSDPRFWEAPSIEEQNSVWNALQPTINHFSDITGEDFYREDAVLLPFGYMAVYNHINAKLAQWCFTNLESKHRWLIGGGNSAQLFQLERWYGLIEDYEYAPNWPHRLKNKRGKIIQNPDCFACEACIRINIFCYGHREDYRSRCKPCRMMLRECSKTLV